MANVYSYFKLPWAWVAPGFELPQTWVAMGFSPRTKSYYPAGFSRKIAPTLCDQQLFSWFYHHNKRFLNLCGQNHQYPNFINTIVYFIRFLPLISQINAEFATPTVCHLSRQAGYRWDTSFLVIYVLHDYIYNNFEAYLPKHPRSAGILVKYSVHHALTQYRPILQYYCRRLHQDFWTYSLV